MASQAGAAAIQQHVANLGWMHRAAIWLMSDPVWLLSVVGLITAPLLLISLWATRQMLRDISAKEAHER